MPKGISPQRRRGRKGRNGFRFGVGGGGEGGRVTPPVAPRDAKPRTSNPEPRTSHPRTPERHLNGKRRTANGERQRRRIRTSTTTRTISPNPKTPNAELQTPKHYRPVDEGRSSRCSVSNFRRSNWVTASRAANTFTPVFATDSKRRTRLFPLFSRYSR